MIKTADGQQLQYFVHKYEVQLAYGGPEEGGWYFDSGVPVEDWVSIGFEDEEKAFDYCRMCNHQESVRRETLQYGYTSVLSHREEFFTFDVDENPVPTAFPAVRPHYE